MEFVPVHARKKIYREAESRGVRETDKTIRFNGFPKEVSHPQGM